MTSASRGLEDAAKSGFPFLQMVAIEVTSRCNLRCTYCMVSQPTYLGRDMPTEMVGEVLEECRRRQVAHVCINGHGETTFRKGWVDLFAPVVGEFGLSVVSNLARRFDEAEVEFLSRLENLNVSLDVADPVVLRKIRRSVDLETVTRNLRRIRAAAERRGARPPMLVMSAGLYDQSVPHVLGLAEYAARLGFSHLSFWSPVKHPELPGVDNVRLLSALPAEERRQAVARIEAATAALERHGISCEFAGDFLEVLKRQGDRQPAADAPANRIFDTAGEGETRDCLEPWVYSQVTAIGDVYPCCAHSPLGRIGADGRYADILGGERMRRLRHGLYHGVLDEECRNCHLRPRVAVGELQRRHARELGPAGALGPPWPAVAAPRELPAGGRFRRLRVAARRWSPQLRRWTARVTGAAGRLEHPRDGSASGRQLVVEGWCFGVRDPVASGRLYVDGVAGPTVVVERSRVDVRRVFRELAPIACGFRQVVEVPQTVAAGATFRLWIDFERPSGARLLRLGPVTLRLAAAPGDA